MNHYNSIIPRLFHWKREPWAVTLGPKTTFYTEPETNVSEHWKKHENKHQARIAEEMDRFWKPFRWMGWLRFMFWYVRNMITEGYVKNDEEVVAREASET
jgi:hypothetical protein